MASKEKILGKSTKITVDKWKVQTLKSGEKLRRRRVTKGGKTRIQIQKYQKGGWINI